MRSLTLKLTLAFLFVGLTGALMVTVLLSRQTQNTFDRFVIDAYQEQVVPQLAGYYATVGSWDGIDSALRGAQPGDGRGPQGMMRRRAWGPGIVLLDVDGTVLVPGLGLENGDRVNPDSLRGAVAIEVENETVGWLVVGELERSGIPAGSPEAAFLSNINRAAVISALGATLIALLLGILLAQTIARPIRKLTAATKQLAAGELGYQVDIRSRDEIGELADSFNLMSADMARSTQLRRQMTADIAHDLRTPLSVLMGYTEALSDGKLQGSEAIFGVMHKETVHLSHLISDLRTLSLADSGELPLTRRAVPPRDLLEHTALAHMTAAEAKGVALLVTSAEPVANLLIDPERIAQVLGNLVSNAIRFTPEGGQVTLGAADGQLTVSDTGAGIPAADLPHIFDRFYRGDLARTQDGSSGLGLAIARSIVLAHGGEIEVVAAEGQGTTFIITLPAAVAAVAAST